VAAAPTNGTEDLLRDQHVREHRMLIPVRHGDGTGDPVLIAGNPIKIAGRVEPASTDYPRIGEHTAQILRDGLGLNAARLRQLESDGLIALDPDDPERGRRSSAPTPRRLTHWTTRTTKASTLISASTSSRSGGTDPS
jgi:hypothetical protein